MNKFNDKIISDIISLKFKPNELIISSGANKGVALIGSLSEIAKHYHIKNFDYYTGCSIGALIAFMLIIGYNIDDLNNILLKIDFETFQDMKIINLLEKCGFDEGKKMTNFIKAIILNKNYESGITFKELYEKTNKILTITTVNITKGIAEYHNIYNTPDLSILMSLRMTTNIPIVFSPILYNGNYYVDGALLDPYPYYYIKDTNKFGLWLFQEDEFKFFKNYNGSFITNIDNSFVYINNLLRIIYSNYMKKYYKNIPKNTIYIDFNYDKITFDMTMEDRLKMYKIGINKCKKFIYLFVKKEKKNIILKYWNIWKDYK
jgi:predicted acylesterase/phospholipase RssA